MNTLRPFLSITIWFTALVACAPAPKEPAPASPRERRATIETIGPDWSAAAVTITCQGAFCRPQVGLLAYAEPAKNLLHRCTATLIDRDHVLSSYHCILDGQVGWFIVPAGVRKITGVTFKAYAGKDQRDKIIVAPDAVILKLDRPFDDVTPLALAAVGEPTFDRMEAVVINPGDKQNTYRLDRVACVTGRHPSLFPFDLTENPDLIRGRDCHIVAGNSGAPMFGPGDDRVQAVVQMLDLSQPDLAYAANARCFTKDPGCVRVNAAEIDRRVNPASNDSAGGLSKEAAERFAAPGATTRAGYRTGNEVSALRLAAPLNGREAFEVIDLPRCVRPGPRHLKDVRLLDQLVTADADGRFIEVQRREIVGRVTSRYAEHYSIEVQWPEPFAPLEHPEWHPSRKADLASPFKVDLPECPR